jgi:hypothetical protein
MGALKLMSIQPGKLAVRSTPSMLEPVTTNAGKLAAPVKPATDKW